LCFSFSKKVSDSSPSRVPGQVVTGTGFINAGLIMSKEISPLTNAAFGRSFRITCHHSA
jgi:uncharacterized membrane protein YhiD involved in acid resistance